MFLQKKKQRKYGFFSLNKITLLWRQRCHVPVHVAWLFRRLATIGLVRRAFSVAQQLMASNCVCDEYFRSKEEKKEQTEHRLGIAAKESIAEQRCKNFENINISIACLEV